MSISGLWDPRSVPLPLKYVLHCHSQAEVFSQKAHTCHSDLVMPTLLVKTGGTLMAITYKIVNGYAFHLIIVSRINRSVLMERTWAGFFELPARVLKSKTIN